MTPVDFSEMECSVARTLETIGDRWTILILRDAFYGVRRFEDFRGDLGVASNILTDRLQKLVDREILEKRQYEERPPRYEYRLTEKGQELLPVILTMMKWGDRWANSGSTPPVTLTHTTCGHVTEPVVTCSQCGEELRRRDLRAHPITVRGGNPSGELARAETS
ncbi:MAG: transcriptional regulator [Actinobacteria bacterium]|nr:transcriptional regulator [Actinomycetota bacterium]